MAAIITEEKKKEMAQQIKQQMTLYKVYMSVLPLIYSVLKEYDGKQITKRIKTKMEEALTDYSIYYNVGFTYYELVIWGKEIAYNDRFTIYLQKVTDGKTFDYDKMLKTYTFNPNVEHYKEQYKKLNNVFFKLDHYINEYNELLEVVKEKSLFFEKNIPYPTKEHFSFDFKYIHI